MDDEDRTDVPDVASESVSAVVATTAGIGVGALIGGPVGAAVGATVGAGASPWINYVGGWIAERRSRLFAPSLEVAGSEEALAERFAAEPALVPVVLRAADAASRTALDDHVDALAAVLRDGVRGDLSVSDTGRIMDAIGLMNADAVLVLDLLVETVPMDGSMALDREVAEQVGIARSNARTALGRLEEGGTVAFTGNGYDGGELYKPTDLAVRVLEYLREVGAAPTSDAPSGDA